MDWEGFGGSGKGGTGLACPPMLRDSGTLMWDAGLLGATPVLIAEPPPLSNQPVEEAPRGAQSSHLYVAHGTSLFGPFFGAPSASVQEPMKASEQSMR